jgi:drug resistance transporter, Bcr/CflA subfamily
MEAETQADVLVPAGGRGREGGAEVSRKGLPFLLAALGAIGPFSIDAYLPSFREIGEHFGAEPMVVQQTLSAYFITFAVMTLWHGVLADSFGRRRITLIAIAAYGLASLGCLFSWSIEALIFFRALQGVSAGAGVVIGRAIVRDLFDGVEARRLMSRIAAVFAIAPALAPVVGGWLHAWFGWRSVFVLLVLMAIALWMACYRHLPETLARKDRQPLRVGPVVRGYGKALGSGRFLTLVVALSLGFSAVFIYIASAPSFLMDVLHREETGFLWLFGPITIGLLIGSRWASVVAGRWGNLRTVGVAYGVMAVAVLFNLGFHFWHEAALPWSVAPVAIYVVGNALASPSLTVMALDLMPHNRGLAASCQSFLQTGGNALIAAVVAPLFWGSALKLSIGMALIFALCASSFFGYALWQRRVSRAIWGG